MRRAALAIGIAAVAAGLGFAVDRVPMNVLLGSGGLAVAGVGVLLMPRRHRAPAERVPVPPAIPLIVLALPTALGINYVSPPLAALLLVGITAVALWSNREWSLLNEPRCQVLLGMAALSLFIFGRSYLFASLAAVATFCVTITAGAVRVPISTKFRWCARAIELYLVANAVAFFGLGLRSSTAAGRLSGYEASLGIVETRTFFPLAGSLIVPSIFGAVLVCWSVHALLSRSGNTVEWVLSFGLGMFFMVAADYRVPILTSGVLIALSLLSARWFRRAAPVIAIVALLLPFWWNAGDNAIAESVTQSQSVAGSVLLQRPDESGSSGFMTLNNRTRIWAICEDVLGTAPLPKLLIGYGFRGQVASGASHQLNSITTSFAAANSISAHNSVLQTMFDGGLIGAAALLGFVLLALHDGATPDDAAWRRRRRARGWGPTQLALLVVVVSGATEATLAPGSGSETYWLFFLVAGIGITSRAQERAAERRASAAGTTAVAQTGDVPAAAG